MMPRELFSRIPYKALKRNRFSVHSGTSTHNRPMSGRRDLRRPTAQSSSRTQPTPRLANGPYAGPTRHPEGRDTPLPGASCAAGRRSGPAPRCALACRAAPPCGLGTRHPAGIYPPGRAGASSKNPRSFASSWPIAGVMLPRRAKMTSASGWPRKFIIAEG